MKNKKGFAIYKIIILTVVLGFLFVIIFTAISKNTTSSKEKEYENYKNLIINAARTWKLANNIESDITISLCLLQSDDYIGELINPLTDEVIPNDSKIIIENNNYTFVEGKYNLKTCASDDLFIYYELDATNTSPAQLPLISNDVKKTIITLNDEEIKNIYVNKKATYKIIYTLTNNTTYTKYLIIKDTTKPKITLNTNNYNYDTQSKTLRVQKNTNFTPPTANFTDNSMLNLVTSINSNVDTNKTGTYEIIYKAIDESKNEETLKITVLVESPNQNENYYVETQSFTNTPNINLSLKALDATEMCISNSSSCTTWQKYQEESPWKIDKTDSTVYVYYKTKNNEIIMTSTNVHLDTTAPVYDSSKNILLGVNYNLKDIIKAYDAESGIGEITINNNTSYQANKLGENNITINIKDKAGNKVSKQVTLLSYDRLKCDASVTLEANENGLMKDLYNTNRCVYTGQNPNNYITFNNELYRIISIESDGRIKIIKDDSIIELAYGTTSFDTSNIKSYLNNNYYNLIKTKSLITQSNFLYGSIYGRTINEIITNDASRLTKNFVALPSLTDFIKAGTCNTTWDKMISNNNPCKQNNWLYSGKEYWLLTNHDNKPMYISSTGSISYINQATTKQVRPVLYLDANTIIIGGNGTKENSYKVLDKTEPSTLTCTITTSQNYELVKELTVNANKNATFSFDGINFSSSNKKLVGQEGIIKAYVKTSDEVNVCSIRLFAKEEYRYKTCPNENKTFSTWYITGTSRENLNYEITPKSTAEKNYLNHYEVVDEAPCNNCKWVTKYERKVENCSSFDSATWSSWQDTKPENNPDILIDNPRIKYGTK